MENEKSVQNSELITVFNLDVHMYYYTVFWLNQKILIHSRDMTDEPFHWNILDVQDQFLLTVILFGGRWWETTYKLAFS